MTNEELKSKFAAIRCGDKEAFADFYRDFKIPVYTLVCRIVQDRHAAEDVMQELFVKLYTNAPGESVENLRQYIFKSAHNMAVDELRRRDRKPVLTEKTASVPEPDVSDMDAEWAIERLDLQQRQIVTMHLNAGLKFEEIGGIIGMSQSAVYRRYKKRLKICVST